MAVTFGGTGEAALRKAFGFKDRNVIQSGNYPGHVLDTAARLGFRRVLICGHPGKLLKVAAGSFNTHNRIADGRLEALCAHAAMLGAPSDIVKALYECRTTENAMRIIKEENLSGVWNALAAAAARRCSEHVFGELEVEAAFTDNEGVVLGRTDGAAFSG